MWIGNVAATVLARYGDLTPHVFRIPVTSFLAVANSCANRYVRGDDMNAVAQYAGKSVAQIKVELRIVTALQ